MRSPTLNDLYRNFTQCLWAGDNEPLRALIDPGHFTASFPGFEGIGLAKLIELATEYRAALPGFGRQVTNNQVVSGHFGVAADFSTKFRHEGSFVDYLGATHYPSGVTDTLDCADFMRFNNRGEVTGFRHIHDRIQLSNLLRL